MRPRPPEYAGPLALVVLSALAIHASALSRPFFADDYLFLDLVARRPGLAAFTAPDAIGNFFRPLARAGWFALLAPLSGPSSAVFHAANLLLFALALGLVAHVAWRALGGPGRGARTAAVAAAAFLALHEAFDVPVGWVSGSQDLLALVGALGAVALALAGRAWWGALALLAGLLCKESISPAPLAAFALLWAALGSWRAAARRAGPLLLATALWAAAWWALRARGVGAHAPVTAQPADFAAALAHGLQVAPGLELAIGRRIHVGGPSLLALLLATAAVFVAARPGSRGAGRKGRAARAQAAPARPGAVALAGAAWFGLGALATAPVAPIWSAYYYSFALCGAALALGAGLAGRRPWIAAAAVALLGFGSAQARGVDQFAARENRWIAVSHLNRAYLDRGMTLLARLTGELKAARPSVPPRTTFYFSGVPSFTGFQVGDGPYVRYAYHDTTLRSRFLSSFSRRDVERGPVLFLTEYDGKLTDRSDAHMYALLGTVLVIGEHVPQAEDAFRASVEREPDAAKLAQLWLDWLTAPGPRRPAEGAEATARLAAARASLARRDTAQAFEAMVLASERWPDDPRLHGIVADLVATAQPNGSYTLFQAYAARTLTPADPAAWRRWALLVVGLHDDVAGLKAIAEWKRVAGPASAQDATMDALERALRGHLPTDRIVTAALGVH